MKLSRFKWITKIVEQSLCRYRSPLRFAVERETQITPTASGSAGGSKQTTALTR
jgi:hypothetical protein